MRVSFSTLLLVASLAGVGPVGGEMGWVEGTVVDTAGKPVAGINVYRGVADKMQIRRPIAATTDGMGRFKFGVAPGRYLLTAYDEPRGYPDTILAVFSYGHDNAGVFIDVKSGGTVQDVVIETAPNPGHLTILVVDDRTGKPIVGARLNVEIFGKPEIFMGNSAGHVDGIPVELIVPAEVDLRLTVEAPGYVSKVLRQGDSERVRFKQGERRDLVVRLGRGSRE